MDIIKTLSEEFNIKPAQVKGTVELIEAGNTIPFIARYRKEVTGSLDDAVLRDFDERLKYLKALQDRKAEIKELIEKQGALTDELAAKIDGAVILREIEDIYRPYRPKRKTRASVAKEKGLAPLAQKIYLQAEKHGSVTEIASEYVNPEKGVIRPMRQ